MRPEFVLILLFCYFGLLLLISHFTSRNANEESFFTGNRQSPWFVVAFGMIGATLSGVTFISIPGWVKTSQFTYMQMVLGYLVGYAFIAMVLLPIYYKLGLASIYSYLGERLGSVAHRTGAIFFLVSRLFGSALRLYLVVLVLQTFVFDAWNVPFFVTAIASIVLIWIYTFRSGIKTIVWTDTLQTFFMLMSLVVSLIIICHKMDWSFSQAIQLSSEAGYTDWLVMDNWLVKNHFFKHFFGGALVAIAMTGMDQDMMQKNLTCKTVKDAQKNMFWFSLTLVIVNLAFLFLGAMLYLFASENNISLPAQSDLLYPIMARDHLGEVAGFMFLIGIIAAAYSSADSALTALTTSFCFDVIDLKKIVPEKRKFTRMAVHIGFSVLSLLIIVLFNEFTDKESNVIGVLFKIAGYTYGPLMGMFFFGIFTQRNSEGTTVLLATILAPVLSFILDIYSAEILWGYQFGYELLGINAGITFLILFVFSRKRNMITPLAQADALQ